MGILLTVDGKPRKRDPAVDGPAKPPKPVQEDVESCREALDTIFRKKNENVVLYEPILKQLMSIQDAVKRDEMAWLEKKKKKSKVAHQHK
jgi:flagellar motor component MotA